MLPGVDDAPSRFYGHAGGEPTLVLFPGRLRSSALVELAESIRALGAGAVCWIVRDRADLPPGTPGYLDGDGVVSAGWGADQDRGAVVVLDANLRIIEALAPDASPELVLSLLQGARYPAAATTIISQAPVLIVPRIIDETECAELIARCRAESVETGVETSLGTSPIDGVRKRRRDVSVTDRQQLAHLSASVGRRLMPEIARAFAYRATRFEGFKIAWYDESSGGFFAPHRDNLVPTTAHRVFALSINLNDDYEGGELGFPEYGAERYRAPAGGAMVFSCALMHSVHPVVRGSRFVLLSFLYAGERG